MPAALAVLASVALIANDAGPAPGATARAVARATIVRPVVMRIAEDGQVRVTGSDRAVPVPAPRRTVRPCAAEADGHTCPLIVTDLP